MLSKRSVIAGLVVLNLLLAAALFLGTRSSFAYAQTGGRGGNFLCVTAKVGGQSYDVVYMLDTVEHKLHAMYPTNVQAKDFGFAPFRDLSKDFQKK